MNTTSNTIEALLFATAEPQTVSALSTRLGVPVSEINEAIELLQSALGDHGIMLIVHNDIVALATRPEHAALLESVRKDELSKELTKAAAETLATIVYHPGISKAQIEFIRGVNTSYSLRNLQIRGLIEQVGNGRAVTYHPTIALLESYGVSSIDALPQYTETHDKIAALLIAPEAHV